MERGHNYVVVLLVAAVALAAVLVINQPKTVGAPINPGEEIIPGTGGPGTGGDMAVLAMLASDSVKYVGQQITVTVAVTNLQSPVLYGWQVDMVYNPSVLRYIPPAVEGTMLNADGTLTYFSQPRMSFGLLDDSAGTRTGLTAAPGLQGDLAVFTFEVIGVGDGGIGFGIDHILSDINSNPIPHVIISSGVTGIQCIDMDHDTYGQYCSAGPDCDDNNPFINPGMIEVPYNGLDDDCNAATLDDDLDGDTFNLANDCSLTNNQDNDPSVNPAKTEVPYNGKDDDCNPATRDNDLDGDGFPVPEDCNDNDPNTYPGAPDPPYDGIDQDCSGVDSNDLDNDGYVLANDCSVADPHDNDPLINPSMTEVPYNGKDDDCNALTPDDDLDSDGYLRANDCSPLDNKDNNPAINPGATELPYNGIDDNCNGIIDEGCPREDVNHDRIVNILDLTFVASRFGSVPGDGRYDVRADLIPVAGPDGVINIFDLVDVATHFGQTC